MARLVSSSIRLAFFAWCSLILLLLLAAPSIRVTSAARTVPVALVEKHGQVASQLMEAAIVAYGVERPDLDLTGALGTTVQMVQAQYSNPATVDFIVTGQAPGAVYHSEIDQLVQAAGTTIASFPVAASAIVPVYNLPGQTVPLLLTRQMLASIMLGDITRWDDPLLVNLNPAITFPSANITIALPSEAQTQTLSFTQAMSKFDSTWVTKMGEPSDTAPWPTEKYANYVRLSGALSSYVTSNPYSFSFALISNAVPLGAQRASMINKAGQVVVGGTASINYAFLELGATPNSAGTMVWNQDMSDGSGYESWPMTFSIAVYLPLTKARTTCLARAEVVNFWLWFLASNVVDSIASGLSISILPDLVFTNLDLNTYLRTTLKCEGESIAAISSNQIDVVGVSLASIYSDLSSSYLSFYGSTDASYNYKYSAITELQAIQQLSAHEVDAAMIVPHQFMRMNEALLEAHAYDVDKYEAGLDTGDLLVMPYALYGITVIHTLPTAVSAIWTQWPLLVTVDLLGKIFSGSVGTWTDPELEALNPGLTAAFTSVGASVNITLVVCCKAGATSTSPSPVSNAFITTLNTTSPTFQGTTKWTLPASWTYVTQQLNGLGRPLIDVTQETQMESAVIRTQGSIGYKLSYENIQDVTRDFSIVRYTQAGTLRAPSTALRTVLSPTIATLQQCAQSLTPTIDLTWDPSNVMPTATNIDQVANCYPFTILSSIVVPSSYSGSECTTGNHTLSLVAWMLTESTLNTSASARGMLRISQVTGMEDMLIKAINSVVCDGETLQIVKPKVWHLSSAITAFGWAMAAIGWICVAISGVILGIYRNRSVIRSSSVPFQFVILFGVAVLFAAVGIFGSAPSTPNCQALAWLLNIGFTLVFGPLFAKMWRIYRIFDTRRLKVVKISNEYLAMLPAAMVLKDVIINSVWQATSPVYAAPMYEVENGRTTTYMQCTGDSGSLPFLLIILVLKFLLLVFGSFMGFTTRNVNSTFNESKNVAWAIYSVFFSVAIIVPIIFFSNAVGDSFTILIVFLLVWIAFTTMLLNFGSKFLLLFKSDDHGAGYSQAHSDSTGDMGMGGSSQLFSFPSLAVLPKAVLDRYIAALENQMRTAKMRHKVLLADGGVIRPEQATSNGVQGIGGTQGLTGTTGLKKRSKLGDSDLGNNSSLAPSPVQNNWGSAADSYRVIDDDTISVRASPSASPPLTGFTFARSPSPAGAAPAAAAGGAPTRSTGLNRPAPIQTGTSAPVSTRSSFSQPGNAKNMAGEPNQASNAGGRGVNRAPSAVEMQTLNGERDGPDMDLASSPSYVVDADVDARTAIHLPTSSDALDPDSQNARPTIRVHLPQSSVSLGAAVGEPSPPASSGEGLTWGDNIDPSDHLLAQAQQQQERSGEVSMASKSIDASKRASEEKPKER